MAGSSKFLKDNGLSIAFWLLFVVCIVGQAVCGYLLQAEDPAGQSHSSTFFEYLTTAGFLKGVFSNWQAALLQLFTLIVFTVFLRQRGASHSRKTEEEFPTKNPDRTGWFGRSRSWAYCNSLSLAFLSLFAGSFVVFFFADVSDYNQERMKLNEASLGKVEFLFSAKFWFDTMQTWQAEFFAMGAFLVFSIFLRQENSAESKPLESNDEETGETNK